MINPEDGISNLDLPIAQIIRQALADLSPDKRLSVLASMTEDEFVSHCADIFLAELETAMHQGVDELGAKEIALKECLAPIREGNG